MGSVYFKSGKDKIPLVKKNFFDYSAINIDG
jgi:hypothetical protein